MTAPQAVTTVDLLRHGACEGGNIFRGVTDSAITGEGWRQMASALTGRDGWQRVISSPLQRCRRFAERFAVTHDLPFTVTPKLRELHFGDWEGREIAAVWAEQSAFLERYYREPGELAAPGGESARAATERLVDVWQEILTRYRGEHLLVVCHGGVIRLLLCQLLAAPLASSSFFHVPHGCLVRLQIHHLEDSDVPQLIFYQSSPNGAPSDRMSSSTQGGGSGNGDR